MDMKIFAELLKTQDPELMAHFDEIYVDISVIGTNLTNDFSHESFAALPWFLCFFVGYVPWEVSLRIIDSFLTEGPNVLLQVPSCWFVHC